MIPLDAGEISLLNYKKRKELRSIKMEIKSGGGNSRVSRVWFNLQPPRATALASLPAVAAIFHRIKVAVTVQLYRCLVQQLMSTAIRKYVSHTFVRDPASPSCYDWRVESITLSCLDM